MKDVGETQIQLDKRMIRNEIHKLEKKLVQIDKEKKTQRKNRQGTYKVALVGYTNAGKSTLMNYLTGANTLVEDKLFATYRINFLTFRIIPISFYYCFINKFNSLFIRLIFIE